MHFGSGAVAICYTDHPAGKIFLTALKQNTQKCTNLPGALHERAETQKILRFEVYDGNEEINDLK